MGWKSTITIEREEAIRLIMSRVLLTPNEELGDILCAMGFGDKQGLEYFGHNFNVVDKKEANDSYK